MIDTDDTKALIQPETEKSEPEETETPETQSEESVEVLLAVGLALMKDGQDRSGQDVTDYAIALSESTLGRSFMDELTGSFNLPDWLASKIAQSVLRASGHVDDSTDLTPLVAIVQKTVKEWNDSDHTAQCKFGGEMFVAGRLSHKAETR